MKLFLKISLLFLSDLGTCWFGNDTSLKEEGGKLNASLCGLSPQPPVFLISVRLLPHTGSGPRNKRVLTACFAYPQISLWASFLPPSLLPSFTACLEATLPSYSYIYMAGIWASPVYLRQGFHMWFQHGCCKGFRVIFSHQYWNKS